MTFSLSTSLNIKIRRILTVVYHCLATPAPDSMASLSSSIWPRRAFARQCQSFLCIRTYSAGVPTNESKAVSPEQVIADTPRPRKRSDPLQVLDRPLGVAKRPSTYAPSKFHRVIGLLTDRDKIMAERKHLYVVPVSISGCR